MWFIFECISHHLWGDTNTFLEFTEVIIRLKSIESVLNKYKKMLVLVLWQLNSNFEFSKRYKKKSQIQNCQFGLKQTLDN